MKASKRALSGVLVAILALLSSCSSGGTENSSTESSTSEISSQTENSSSPIVNKTGLPIVDEPITLKGLVALDIKVSDWNTHPAAVELENRTNIYIDWECVAQEGFTEKRNLIFASNTLPDLVMRAALSVEQEVKYSSAGQIIALDPYFEEYAPNFNALLESNEGIYKNIVLPDGHVYSMPQLNATEGNLIDKHWINQVWLDNLNLEMPETTEELYDVLKAFKEEDANGDGDPSNEIPFSSNKTYASDLIKPYYGAWRFGKNHGIIDRYLDVDDENKVRLIPLEPNYKEILSYLNRLWTENLLDHEVFSQNETQLVSKITDNSVGYSAQTNQNQWMGARRDDFVAAPSLTGPYGDNAWVQVSPFVQTTGTFVITNVNPYPEATMRWVDYFYSKEGMVLIRLGIEGKSYIINDEGNYELLPEIQNPPDGLSMTQAHAKWALYFGGCVPQYITDEIDLSSAQLPEIKAATELLRPYLVPYEDIPRLKYTEEETIALGRFAEDIRNFIDENSVKFITGERSLDEFDQFVKDLQVMDIDEYLKVQQASFDRWLND